MTKTTSKAYDIIIIGGGLSGLSQAILLGKQGWSVACIDRDTPQTQQQDNFDIRTTAISWGSRNLLSHTGIWDGLLPKAECIKDILIKDEDSPIELVFNSADINAEGFGWIVDNRDLRASLLDAVTTYETIDHLTGRNVTALSQDADDVSVTMDNGDTITSRLLIGSDGRGSLTRQSMNVKTWTKNYKQSAIVCLINHTKPHNGLALEHFRTQGPFAILPFTNDDKGQYRSALVWTVENAEAKKWCETDEPLFNAALQSRCGDIYGDITVSGGRSAWPLNVVKAHQYIDGRMLIMADAAHGMHPIAGQGLNMGFRDIAALTELLHNASDPGAQDIMQAYQKSRRADNYGMVAATDILNGLFGHNLFGVRAARRFGLHAVSRIPFAKKFFMKQAMGAAGRLPYMIKNAA